MFLNNEKKNIRFSFYDSEESVDMLLILMQENDPDLIKPDVILSTPQLPEDKIETLVSHGIIVYHGLTREESLRLQMDALTEIIDYCGRAIEKELMRIESNLLYRAKNISNIIYDRIMFSEEDSDIVKEEMKEHE